MCKLSRNYVYNVNNNYKQFLLHRATIYVQKLQMVQIQQEILHKIFCEKSYAHNTRRLTICSEVDLLLGQFFMENTMPPYFIITNSSRSSET